MAEEIHPDALRATADVLEQIQEVGLHPTLLHIEAEPGVPDHHIVNIDAVGQGLQDEHPDALQRVLNDITSDHAEDLAVAAPEAPMHPEEFGPVYWDLEAMIRIQRDGD